MNRTLAIAGFSVLSVVAVTGWVRKPELPAAPAAINAPLGAAPTGYALVPVYGGQPTASNYMTPAVYRDSVPVRVQTVADRPATVRREVVRTYKQPRSTKKSALIIGGSAGTGAAIGAIAGGGKGAAIGALSGGAAGFIYDRLTANR